MKMKKSLKELLLGKEEVSTYQKKLTSLLILILMLGSTALMSWIGGYYSASGSFPGEEPTIKLPPTITVTSTTQDIEEYLESQPVITPEGDWNCVESALLLERQASWDGINAVAIGLEYDNGAGHLIEGFPTEDGWIFVEPQTNKVINPVVGAIYLGYRIEKMWMLDITWIPLEMS